MAGNEINLSFPWPYRPPRIDSGTRGIEHCGHPPTLGIPPMHRRFVLIATFVCAVMTSVPGWAQSPTEEFDPGMDGPPFAVALQPDGKILVGGDFTTIGGGGTGNTQRLSLARLNADGSVDTLGGQLRERIGRLNSNGLADAGFNPTVGQDPEAIVVQPDGKILVAGTFTTLGGG